MLIVAKYKIPRKYVFSKSQRETFSNRWFTVFLATMYWGSKRQRSPQDEQT